MNLVSVNCGLPREVVWRGTHVTTSIYKEPVEGPVALRRLNLDGDRQSDLTVHGGKDKAVYCYPIEYYSYWNSELPGRSLAYGSFGENFTVEGLAQDNLAEDFVYVGDRFSVGPAEVVVTQPRLPCYKLGIKFESDEMVKRFLISRRTGFYAAVILEGEVRASDPVTLLSHDPDSVPVSLITRLYAAKNYTSEDVALVHRAIAAKSLPDSWKAYFQEKLNRLGG